MLRRSRILAVLALGVAGGIAALVWEHERTDRSEESGSDAPARSIAVEEPPALVEPPPAATIEAPVVTAAPASAQDERQPIVSAYEEELARAQWVAGRVLLPQGTPADELAFVVARGKDFAHGPLCRVKLAPDGSFRVAFSEKSKTGWLALEARYLYLQQMKHWKRAEAEPVVLEPELGARWKVRLRLPAGVDGEAIDGRIGMTPRPGDVPMDEAYLRAFREPPHVDADLSHTFDALRCGWKYQLSYAGADFASDALVIEPRAGEFREQELELMDGVTLSGRVIDETGQPVAGAHVLAIAEEDASSAARRYQDTDELGRFTLRALLPGDATLQVNRKDPVVVSQALGILRDGERREGIELVLARGAGIAGRVVYPDGKPAVAAIDLSSDRSKGEWHQEAMMSGADGSFSFSGLREERYELTTRIDPEDDNSSRDEQLLPTWQTRAENVPPGTNDLVLTLSPGETLELHVVDESGAAVTKCRIEGERLVHYAKNSEGSELGFWSTRESPGGVYLVEHLLKGEWKLRVTATGFGSPAEQIVDVPGSGSLTFVMPGLATVRGVVLDPAGRPLAGAYVAAHSWHAQEGKGARTDALGAFELQGIEPGEWAVRASDESSAPSAPEKIELASGEVRELRLTLRVGARLTGEFLGIDGRPEARRKIRVGFGDEYHETLVSDAQGAFAAEKLPPGKYWIQAEPSEREIDALAGSRDAGARQLLRRELQVELEDGQTTHVKLEAPRVSPANVRVNVRLDGAAAAGARVSLSADDSSTSYFGIDRGAGSIDALLPHPGPYALSVQLDDTCRLLRRLDVPAAGTQLDLDFTTGTFAGHVAPGGGLPLPGIRIQARADDPSGELLAQAFTTETGDYSVRVPAGTYRVVAGGNESGAAEGHFVFPVSAERTVVVRPGSSKAGVDFELKNP